MPNPAAVTPLVAIAGLARMFEVVLGQHDLTIQKYRVLAFLMIEPSTPSSLAYRLTVQRPTLTRLVQGLVDIDLVERRPSDRDRRQTLLAVTPAGRRALAEADADIQLRLERILGELPKDQAHDAERGLLSTATALRRYWKRTHDDHPA